MYLLRCCTMTEERRSNGVYLDWNLTYPLVKESSNNPVWHVAQYNFYDIRHFENWFPPGISIFYFIFYFSLFFSPVPFLFFPWLLCLVSRSSSCPDGAQLLGFYAKLCLDEPSGSPLFIARNLAWCSLEKSRRLLIREQRWELKIHCRNSVL